MGLAVNLGIVVLILGVTYALSSEGLWGAALMFFNVLFSAIIAFNFYEPVAAWFSSTVGMPGYADTLSLYVIFLICLVMLRIISESIAPAMVRFPPLVYDIGRFLFGLACSLLLIAFLLTTFETSPVHKKVFGVMGYDFKPPFGQGLDRHWLAFFQHTTGTVFANHNSSRSDPEFGTARVFDPRGEWLIQHQNARPYGDDVVPPAEPSATPAAGEDPNQFTAPAPSSGQERSEAGQTVGGTVGAAVGVAVPN